MHKLKCNKMSICKYTASYTHNEHNKWTMFHMLLQCYITATKDVITYDKTCCTAQ